MRVDSALHGLQDRLTGELILPGDNRYEESRKVFNGMIDRRPAVIARCATASDVVASIGFGRDHELEISVRGGGHNVAGLGVGDGILIDLAGLKQIDVDPHAKVARAGGGVLWGELDRATQEHGLHTPGGRVTTTGIGGFTTGGGYGWTSSMYGLACDNLLSAEVVTADGRILAVSDTQHADLFWGIRGGGGNFGVVTRFDFRLHELGPDVLAGLALWPVEHASEVLHGWRDVTADAPDELSSALVILTAPPADFVPEELRGRTAVGVAVMYVGDPAAGLPTVKPFRDLAPAVDLIQPMPYTAFQAILDAASPHGKRTYSRGEYLAHLSDEAIDAFVEYGPIVATDASPFSQMVLFRIGQAVSAVPDDATAFSHRAARYLFHPISVWDDPADDTRRIGANRAIAEVMREFGTGGAYLNFTPEADRVRDAYGAAKYARLVALKDKYDPDNVFRGNQNIAPSSRMTPLLT
jgi:FAD/FMN-containing dehydrogenase